MNAYCISSGTLLELAFRRSLASANRDHDFAVEEYAAGRRRKGGYVHMWFHPHNLITAPAMQTAFVEIMRFAGSLVRTGDLDNLTIGQSLEVLKEKS